MQLCVCLCVCCLHTPPFWQRHHTHSTQSVLLSTGLFVLPYPACLSTHPHSSGHALHVHKHMQGPSHTACATSQVALAAIWQVVAPRDKVQLPFRFGLGWSALAPCGSALSDRRIHVYVRLLCVWHTVWLLDNLFCPPSRAVASPPAAGRNRDLEMSGCRLCATACCMWCADT